MTKVNLLLLHGALANADELNSLVPLLNENYLLNTFHFLGHHQDAIVPFNILQLAEQIQIYCQHNAIQKIFGYSMGGYAALTAAPFLNQHVPIITYGTKFDWSDETILKQEKLLDPQWISAKVPALAKHLQNTLGDQWQDLLLNTVNMMKQLKETHLGSEILANIKQQITLIRGTNDTTVNSEETYTTASRIKNCQVKHIEGGEHLLSKTDLRQLAAIIHQA